MLLSVSLCKLCITSKNIYKSIHYEKTSYVCICSRMYVFNTRLPINHLSKYCTFKYWTHYVNWIHLNKLWLFICLFVFCLFISHFLVYFTLPGLRCSFWLLYWCALMEGTSVYLCAVLHPTYILWLSWIFIVKVFFDLLIALIIQSKLQFFTFTGGRCQTFFSH